jgi:endonuclease YncB( thermonuclease family)
MGPVHQFKRPPKNEHQFRGYRPKPPKVPRRPRWWERSWALWALLIAMVSGVVGTKQLISEANAETFLCSAPQVVDGDTLRCGERRVRLYGIDAPELPGHCRPGRSCTPGDPYASTENLRRLIGSLKLTCRSRDTDVYGRTVARCSAGQVDLSCGQLGGGFAVRRYGVIWC